MIHSHWKVACGYLVNAKECLAVTQAGILSESAAFSHLFKKLQEFAIELH